MAVKAKQQYYADETTIKKEAREFGMIDELKDKLDSIEYGAQVNIIEEVQENGVPLEIVDKSVNVLVPEVIDNLYTIDPNNSLSAKQGKILYDMIKNLLARGRFLSTWNTATGLPVTNPEESPYEYKAGDYYIVGIVAAEGGTNFRPEPGEYVINVASDEQETSEVHVSDIYVYDGENWILLINSTRELAVDDYVDYTYQSTNPVENQAIAKEFVKKQNKFYTVSTTQPSNPVEGDEWYDATNDKVFYWDGTQWKEMGGGSTYTAGLHISIDPNDNNKISVVEWSATSSALGLVKLGSDTEQTATPNNVSSTAGRTYRIQTNSSGQLLVNVPWTDNDTTYTAGTGINIDTSNNNRINCTIKPVHVGSTAPANPGTGDLWYDTTKNTMFLYKNNSWTIIGPEIFPITKANYDALSQAEQNDGRFFLITDNDGTIYVDWENVQDRPMYIGTTAPSNPSEGYLWYDTTNDVLKVYDGTQWNEIGGGTTYAAGNGISISNNEISVDTTVVATKTDLNSKQDVFHTTSSTAPSNPSEGDEWYDSTNDVLKVYDGTNWIVTGKTYTAGDGIDIDANNEISVDVTDIIGTGLSEDSSNNIIVDTSAIQEKLTASDGIDIDGSNNISVDVTDIIGTGLSEDASNNITIDTTVVATQTDLTSKQDKATSGSGAPATTPTYVGQVYIDTTNDNMYVATGTSSSSDWTAVDTNTTYTAGDGIDITNDEISVDTSDLAGTGLSTDANNNLIVDTTVIQEKLTAGDGIDIDANNGISVDVTDIIGTGLSEDASNNIIVDSTVVALKSDLTNYYTKTETYTKTEVDNLISSFGNFEVVTSLPSVSTASEKTIYLLGPIGTGADKYEEYIVTEDSQQQKQWTKIGETSVDLSGYATTTALTNGLATKADTSDVLTKTNTTAFTPTGDYQPATKKYVDDNKGKNDIIESSTAPSDTDVIWKYDPGSSYANEYRYYDGYQWLDIEGIKYDSTEPTLKDNNYGILWYDTTNDILKYYDTNSSTWKSVGGIIDSVGTGLSLSNGALSVDTTVVATQTDLSGKQDKATSGSTAPSTTPTYVGQQYIDTTADKMYVATGTTSSSDWTEVGAGSGDMLYSDYGWTTLTGATVTLALRSEIAPSANFTVNKPNDLKDGQFYVLRVDNGATAYTMTLGTDVTNPYSEDLTLVANNIQQFMFLAKGGNLELQPSTEIDISGKQDKATSGSTAPSTTPSYIGQQYVDTTNDKLYVATGTSSSSDWIEIGAGGGFEVVSALPSISQADDKLQYYVGPIGSLADKYEEYVVTYPTIEDKVTISSSSTSATISDEVTITASDISITRASGLIIAYRINVYQNGNVLFGYSDGGVPSGLLDANGNPVDSITIPAGTISASDFSTITSISIKVGEHTEKTWTKVGETTPDLSQYALDSNVNTKTFTLSSTSDLSTIRDAISWKNAGKNPIIIYDGHEYVTGSYSSGTSWILYSTNVDIGSNSSSQNKMTISYDMGSPVGIAITSENVSSGSGDMLYADFNWVSKTGATVTLDINSTITPSANFTVNAPSTIKDGQIYILRVVNGATAYTMTLGTGITNPYSTSTTLTANGVDQFVFQAIGGNLELLPDTDVDISGKQDKATSGSTAPATTPSYIGQQYVDTTTGTLYVATGTSSSSDWKTVGGGNVIAMTQAEYNALSTAEKNDGKLRIITDAPTEDISIEWSNIANKPSDLTAAQIQAGSSTTSGMVAPSVIAASMPILSTQTGTLSSVKIWVGSQTDYEALTTKDPNTLYFTTNVVSGS